MGLMDMIGGLLGKKGGVGSGGGLDLPGGVQLPGGLGALTGANADILKVLLPMLAGGGALGNLGGLGGILGKLQAAGLGGKAQSWVGTGANEPLEPHEVETALGGDTVAKVAAEAGVSHDEARTGLATLLPKVIDGVTPSGAVPAGEQLHGAVQGLDVSRLLG